MIANPILVGMISFLVVFCGIGVIGYYLLRPRGDDRRVLCRLRELSERASSNRRERMLAWTWLALPKFGALVISAKHDRMKSLRVKLAHGGFFHPNVPHYFMGGKLVLAILGGCIAVLPCWVDLMSWKLFPLACAACCAMGFHLPHLWLSIHVRKRQRVLRRSIPDALDMLVLCLEGGVGLNAALQQVTEELQVVHSVLGAEMIIVHRGVQLGLSAGEALRQFADRCGLDDVRDLASIILQSEKSGASVAKAIRIHADTARIERQQYAEEMGQKAAVKILFPTLLCIFPAIFIVVLGPAAFQLSKMFAR